MNQYYKRYIEIIFDDSGSMRMPHSNTNQPRHEVAKELFVQSVLPTIGRQGDEVVLRLLREGHCSEGVSNAIPLGNKQSRIEQAILGINRFNKSTPLYYTVKDAIEECNKRKENGETFDDYLIFVLTDGGDTCTHDIRDVISEKELKEWKIKIPKLEPVLVQFDVPTEISKRNLSGAFKFLGGFSVNVKDASKGSISAVRKTIAKAGFDGNILLPCVESQPDGPKIAWEELEKQNIKFHQARVLYDSGLLSFQPKLNRRVSHDRLVELKFLIPLVFNSGIDALHVHSMLAQLDSNLMYSHDCIRWDFTRARWVPIEQPHFVSFEHDPDVYWQDGRKELLLDTDERASFIVNRIYRVHCHRNSEFASISREIHPHDDIKTLEDGDLIRFSPKFT